MYKEVRENNYYIKQINRSEDKKLKIEIFKLAIAAIFEIITTIIISIITDYFEGIAAGSSPIEAKQTFTCEEIVSESFFNIEYVTCTLTCEPPISNYQVIPFPYIKVAKDNKEIYIPLDFFYSQKQYVSDAKGVCELKSEKTVGKFIEILQEYYKDKEYVIDGGCILAIRYVDKNNKLGIHLYASRNGQLIELSNIDMEEAEIVIGVTNDSDSYRINMLDWTISNNGLDLPEF